MGKILFLGDCNTLGIQENFQNAYPEKIGKILNREIINCGFTMSTTREGLNFYKEHYSEEISTIVIQYGLVDSWLTFKHSPYILYYPDNTLKKIGRKLVKKIKKVGRKFNLKKLLGEEHVVPVCEYKKNIEFIIKSSKKSSIVLLGTVPSLHEFRNSSIVLFNNALNDLFLEHKDKCFYINLYEEILSKKQYYHSDGIHLNDLGHNFIANAIKDYC